MLIAKIAKSNTRNKLQLKVDLLRQKRITWISSYLDYYLDVNLTRTRYSVYIKNWNLLIKYYHNIHCYNILWILNLIISQHPAVESLSWVWIDAGSSSCVFSLCLSSIRINFKVLVLNYCYSFCFLSTFNADSQIKNLKAVYMIYFYVYSRYQNPHSFQP